MEDKETKELVCKDLRRLAIELNKLAVTPGLELEASVFITIYPDGKVYIE